MNYRHANAKYATAAERDKKYSQFTHFKNSVWKYLPGITDLLLGEVPGGRGCGSGVNG